MILPALSDPLVREVLCGMAVAEAMAPIVERALQPVDDDLAHVVELAERIARRGG